MIRKRFTKITAREYVQWLMSAETSYGVIDCYVRIDMELYVHDRDIAAFELRNAKDDFSEYIAELVSQRICERLTKGESL